MFFLPPGYHVEMVDGRLVLISDKDGTISNIDPLTGQPFGEGTLPGTNQGQPPALPSTVVPGTVPGASGSAAGPSALSGTEAFLPSALKWLGALVLLWIILTALSEHGDPNARTIGRALAGLILLGALFYLGPGAISNVQNLWTQAGNPNPVQGPNPVPGA